MRQKAFPLDFTLPDSPSHVLMCFNNKAGGGSEALVLTFALHFKESGHKQPTSHHFSARYHLAGLLVGWISGYPSDASGRYPLQMPVEGEATRRVLPDSPSMEQLSPRT